MVLISEIQGLVVLRDDILISFQLKDIKNYWVVYWLFDDVFYILIREDGG